MQIFCVNIGEPRNPGRDNEVHNKTTGCKWMPSAQNQKDLGSHDDCHGAVEKAKRTHPKADGCATCCPGCNKG